MSPPEAVPLALANSVLLADGWHDIASSSLAAIIDPVFSDARTGQLITPGDVWVEFTDTAGQIFGCPMRSVLAVKLAGPVAAHTAHADVASAAGAPPAADLLVT